MVAVMEGALLGMMLLSMVAVLMLAWSKFGSLRTAFIVMLLVGKVWAGILYVFGVDHPVARIIITNKIRHASTSLTITATQTIFLSLLGSLLFTLSWPYLEPHLPEPLRRLEVIRR